MIAVPTSARPVPPVFRKSLRPSAPELRLAAAALSAAISLSHRRFLLPNRPRPPEAEGATPGLSASSPEHAAAAAAARVGSDPQWCCGGAPKRPIPPLSGSLAPPPRRLAVSALLPRGTKQPESRVTSHSLKHAVLFLRTNQHTKRRSCVPRDGGRGCVEAGRYGFVRARCLLLLSLASALPKKM